MSRAELLKTSAFLKTSTLLLALTLVAAAGSRKSVIAPVIAQEASPAFPLPTAVPSGTALKLDGSNSMTLVNETFKKRFEEKFAGTQVGLSATGTDSALKGLVDGKLDVAAIGRPLTDEEKAQGLSELVLSREKIAIIVGADNPFKENLTFEQFAKIFRGDIKDWSEVGGPAGPIRLIDRPKTSDTRLSLSRYDVFKTAPFEAVATATTTADDTTASVIKELGKDGIGYAIVGQAANQPGVQILSMHKTLPDDPRYPYSQPRGYVYKSSNATSPAVAAFLGYAASPEGAKVMAEAQKTEAGAAPTTPSPVATPPAAVAPTPTATTVAVAPVPTKPEGGGFGWWPLLLLPLAGGLLWLLKGKGGSSAINEPPVRTVTPPTVTPPAVVPPAVVPPAVVPPAVVPPAVVPPTVVPPTVGQPAVVPPTVAPPAVVPPDRATLSTPTPDVAPPTATPPADLNVAGLGAAAMGAAGLAGVAGLAAAGAKAWQSHITLTPHSPDAVDARWDFDTEHQATLRQQGGTKPMLRLYDVTGIDPDRQPPHSTRQFDYTAGLFNQRLPVPQDNRDYLAELGYVTADDRWLKGVRSNTVRVPSRSANPHLDVAALGVAGVAAGAAAMASGPATINITADEAITLSPIGTKAAYVSWQADDAAKAALKQQGGQTHQVRLYDVTHLDLNHQAPHSMQAFNCPESASDQIVPIPQADRDYIAEVGYAKPDGQWLKLLRSKHLRVPDGSAARAFGTTALDGAALGAAALGGAAGVIAAHAPAERHITLNATTNAFLLDAEQVHRLEHQTAVSQNLQPGRYKVRITQGTFSYRPLMENSGEPLVMLYLRGGQVVNAKTDHPVSGAWTTLNGYADELHLQVVEPTRLLAFFVDTNVQDNDGEVTVVVEQEQQ